MSNSEKLKKFLIQEMIPNLDEAIDKMFLVIEKEKKRASIVDKELLQNLQEIHADCKDILAEIEVGKMNEDEVGDIFRYLMSVKIKL